MRRREERSGAKHSDLEIHRQTRLNFIADVVLVRPEDWGAVGRYVAMTRATQQLVILS